MKLLVSHLDTRPYTQEYIKLTGLSNKQLFYYIDSDNWYNFVMIFIEGTRKFKHDSLINARAL